MGDRHSPGNLVLHCRGAHAFQGWRPRTSVRFAGEFQGIHSDPISEIFCDFSIDPSVDFDFVDPIQLSNLVFDLGGIHNGISMGYCCLCV